MAAHRRPAPSDSVRGGLVAASAVAALAVSVQVAQAQPHPSMDDVKKKVAVLNEQAEQATEAYDGANEKYTALRKQTGQLLDSVAQTQAALNAQRDSLGSIAAAQYRSGGMGQSAQLLLSSDPEAYLDGVSVLDQESSRQAGILRATQDKQRELRQEQAEAASKLSQLSGARSDLARKKRAVQGKLAAAHALLNSLTHQERIHLASQEGAQDSLRPSLGSSTAASQRAAAALTAAKSRLGAPYVWGATGPSSFDCSGLIRWSFAQAGVSLPRTTYEQATVGPRLTMAELRPGDLVFFFSGLTHAGIYAGNGVIVHAPHTGASVRYEKMTTVGPFEFGVRV